MTYKFKNRIFGLDILRSIAILTVLISHTAAFTNIQIHKSITYHFGVFGVELFFVLSGFLIGGIILKLPQNGIITIKSLRTFWIRRWFRTIPNYILALMVHAAVLYFFHNYYFVFYNPKWYLYFVFFQNFISIEPELYGIAWSLSIEEWFYLLFPLLFLILSSYYKVSSKNQLIIIVSFILFIVLLRFNYSLSEILNYDLEIRKRVPYRLDSIVYGVLTAWFWNNYKSKMIKLKLILLWVGLFFIGIGSSIIELNYSNDFRQMNLFNKVFLFTYFNIGCSLLLIFFVRLEVTWSSSIKRSITLISLISYSIYLFHIPIINVIKNYLNPGWLLFASIWMVTIFCSWLIYTYFELPILKFRDKITLKSNKL